MEVDRLWELGERKKAELCAAEMAREKVEMMAAAEEGRTLTKTLAAAPVES